MPNNRTYRVVFKESKREDENIDAYKFDFKGDYGVIFYRLVKPENPIPVAYYPLIDIRKIIDIEQENDSQEKDS